MKDNIESNAKKDENGDGGKLVVDTSQGIVNKYIELLNKKTMIINRYK